MASCGTDGDQDVAFEVVADESKPDVQRVGPDGASTPPVMGGAEVVVTAAAREPDEIQALCDHLGVRDPVPALAAGEALVALAGGQPVACPWTVAGVEARPETLAVRLGTSAGDADCGQSAWEPRALALTVPACALPTGDDVLLTSDSTLPSAVLPPEVISLNPVGPPPWTAADTRSPYQLSKPGASAEHLAAANPAAVTTFPGFDILHLRFSSKRRGRLSASYVTDPPVSVEGQAYLQIELGSPAVSHQRMPRKLNPPASAAITEIKRLPDVPTWIVGLDRDPAPLTLWSRTYDLPEAVGSTRLVGIPHGE